jgi:rhamnulokinase
MPAKIAAFCQETGQPVPETPGQFIRCILESLALLYRKSLDEVERLSGRKISTLHIVGGGSKSVLLNQFTANATGRQVVAGPVEATAIGNLLVQALALGHIESHAALRKIVKESFPVENFQPKENWEEAYQRFLKLSA